MEDCAAKWDRVFLRMTTMRAIKELDALVRKLEARKRGLAKLGKKKTWEEVNLACFFVYHGYWLLADACRAAGTADRMLDVLFDHGDMLDTLENIVCREGRRMLVFSRSFEYFTANEKAALTLGFSDLHRGIQQIYGEFIGKSRAVLSVNERMACRVGSKACGARERRAGLLARAWAAAAGCVGYVASCANRLVKFTEGLNAFRTFRYVFG